MKTSFISNLAVQNAMRLSVQRGQSEVVKLQQEVTTGVHADPGAALGSSAARLVSLKDELQRLTNIKDTNALVTQRLSTSQLAIESMRKAGEEMNTTLVGSMGVDDASRLANTKTALDSTFNAFFVAANSQSNGEYLLSGLNSDARPLTPYAENAAAKQTFADAFASFKQENNSNPANATIATYRDLSAEQMKDFIDRKIVPLYVGDTSAGENAVPAQWMTDWSKASDKNVQSRISGSEVVSTTTNANEAGVRKMVLASVIASQLLTEDLSSQARSVVNETAQNYTQQAISGMISMGSDLGTSEGRVNKANTLLDSQAKLLTTHVGDLEGVDPYEASTRMKSLMTQIETSYTLTSRMQQLSLINFL